MKKWSDGGRHVHLQKKRTYSFREELAYLDVTKSAKIKKAFTKAKKKDVLSRRQADLNVLI